MPHRAIPVIIILLALGLTWLAPPAQANVIGKDGRVEVPDDYARLAEGVGILYNARASFACTAFCVAADMIATNAHCLLRKRGPKGPVKLGDMRFSPYGPLSEDGSSRLRLKSVSDTQPRLSILAGSSRGGASVSQQAGDWAFAKLGYGLCLGRELKFADTAPTTEQIARAARESRLFMIGYHGDKKLTAKWLSPDCGIRSGSDRRHFLPSQRRALRRAGALLPHTCDMSEGASGSPIFMREGDTIRIIAINTGGLGYTRYEQRADGSHRRVVANRITNLSVLASSFADKWQRFERENLLTDLDQFRELQILLKDIGLYRGAIDGLYGPGTRGAILAREEALGLDPLGIPTWELLKGLREDRAAEEIPVSQTLEPTRHLSVDDEGTE